MTSEILVAEFEKSSQRTSYNGSIDSIHYYPATGEVIYNMVSRFFKKGTCISTGVSMEVSN